MKKGLEILLDTYWSKGWIDGTISKEDFEIAKKEGFMFDYPKYMSHDDTLKKLKSLLNQVDPKDVANAFLYSLSTRKLEYRSILGSYCFGKAIPKHEAFVRYGSSLRKCDMCGWYAWYEEPNDYELKHGVNVFNFERYKFGGVRYTNINYVIFDIEQFLKLPKVTPTDEDKEILKRILQCVNKLELNDKVGKLSNLLAKEKILKSNRNERSTLLDILGICGILASNEYPCYEDKFVDVYCRHPFESKNDYLYPINRWRVSDGINYDKFEKVFGYKLKL